MKFECVVTGSTPGNCYIITAKNGKKIILDFGGKFEKIKKKLGFKYSNVECALLTHEHGDHSKNWKEIELLNIPIVTAKKTAEILGITNYFNCDEVFVSETFKVASFHVKHDAVDPRGFIIECDGEKILYVTDTSYIRYKFANVNHFIIETNFSEKLVLDKIRNGERTFVNERVLKSHYSIEMAINYLKQYEDVQNVFGVHISDANGDLNQFKQMLDKEFPLSNNIIVLEGFETFF